MKQWSILNVDGNRFPVAPTQREKKQQKNSWKKTEQNLKTKTISSEFTKNETLEKHWALKITNKKTAHDSYMYCIRSDSEKKIRKSMFGLEFCALCDYRMEEKGLYFCDGCLPYDYVILNVEHIFRTTREKKNSNRKYITHK